MKIIAESTMRRALTCLIGRSSGIERSGIYFTLLINIPYRVLQLMRCFCLFYDPLNPTKRDMLFAVVVVIAVSPVSSPPAPFSKLS